MELALKTLGAGYHFFSKLDLKSGFWQFPINAKDRFKAAFITPFGLYEWNVLPQGLRNAPLSFQRIMNKVLSSCIDFSLVYLDDIIIFSRTYREHLLHLEKVLNGLKLHNLTLNSMKCQIAQQTIAYLGHVISSKTITPLPEKIKSIVLLPEPKSLAQANRFIGGLSWYRKFIPQFASIAASIHAVTNLSKSQRYKFKWGDDQSKSFYDLKNVLTSRPLMLDFPDDTQPILLSTNDSKAGLGGILYQEINDVIPYNTSRQKRPDFLHPVRPSDGANELLGIDFCGPFTPTFTDNREVLCLNNYYTNFVTAIPLPTCLAQVTAEAIFKEHICRFGVPKATISDQGNALNNMLNQKIRYDRRRPDPQYDLATVVLTRIFTNRSKLDPQFSLDPKIIVNRQHPIYPGESFGQ
ncbi:unnamed protein product [Rotaria socialis]|uniref:Reverse transcriptase domain-containing protein n=1 Tax=Rotaria socialis TaxID=392032 RepID=A0A818E4K4_9BILA|nr:unnamed protein product [Rotaria socialis]